MNDVPKSRGGLAALVVRTAGLWLLIGALAKLRMGTPKDLPQLVIDLTPFTLDLTFRLVIAVELAIVFLAFLKPRLAWPVLVLLFAFFEWVLTSQLAAGAESCGCFGATITVSPWLVLGIDTALLVALLVSRPWRIEQKGAPPIALLVTTAVSAVVPWLFIPSTAPARPADPTAAGTEDPPVVETPRYVEWTPANWAGQMIWDVTQLTDWVDPAVLPAEGTLVIWRQSCDHCAEHLTTMAGTDDGSLPILMVQLLDDLEADPVVELMPQGEHVTHAKMPEGLQVVVQTPWVLGIEGGTFASVHGPEDLELEDS